MSEYGRYVKPLRGARRREPGGGNNPQVYEWFDYYVREMLDAGVKRIGAPVIWERIRYETYLDVAEKPYRLPNQLRPYYAREFQKRNPELADRIRTRKLRHEDEREAA